MLITNHMLFEITKQRLFFQIGPKKKSLCLPAYLPSSYREHACYSHQKVSTSYLEKVIMLAQKEIKQIEKVSIELKKWADNLSYKRPSPTKVTLTPSSRWRYKKEILLLCAKTNLGAKVEKDFTELDHFHQEYESWRAKTLTEDNEEEFNTLVTNLKGSLYDLANMLNQIAESERKERNQWILKLIFYVTSAVVVFLASLLTCIYLLWWLWTKIFSGPT